MGRETSANGVCCMWEAGRGDKGQGRSSAYRTDERGGIGVATTVRSKFAYVCIASWCEGEKKSQSEGWPRQGVKARDSEESERGSRDGPLHEVIDESSSGGARLGGRVDGLLRVEPARDVARERDLLRFTRSSSSRSRISCSLISASVIG